jgi:hypothetical protein
MDDTTADAVLFVISAATLAAYAALGAAPMALYPRMSDSARGLFTLLFPAHALLCVAREERLLHPGRLGREADALAHLLGRGAASAACCAAAWLMPPAGSGDFLVRAGLVIFAIFVLCSSSNR